MVILSCSSVHCTVSRSRCDNLTRDAWYHHAPAAPPPLWMMIRHLHAHLAPEGGARASSSQRQAEERAAPSSVTCTLDLEATGAAGPSKQWGSIVVPWSDDRGAWANKLVPICVITGSGDGPATPAHTALLFAGNHGDDCHLPRMLLFCCTAHHHRTSPARCGVSDTVPCVCV